VNGTEVFQPRAHEVVIESSTATNGRYITTSDSTIGADLDKSMLA
jgi:hypothetical protein